MSILNGSVKDDVMVGTDRADEIFGFEGNDIIHGGKGKDKLYGGGGNDTLSGEDDEDELYGGEGNDTLDGGNGADKLFGGNGNDIYYIKDVGIGFALCDLTEIKFCLFKFKFYHCIYPELIIV